MSALTTATSSIEADNWLSTSPYNGTNFGTSNELQLDSRNGPIRYAIVRFTIPNFTGTLTGVRLKYYKHGSSGNSKEISTYNITDTTWTENESTYDTTNGFDFWSPHPNSNTTEITTPFTVTDDNPEWLTFAIMGTGTDNPLSLSQNSEVNIRIAYTLQEGDTGENVYLSSREYTNKPYIEYDYTNEVTQGCLDYRATNYAPLEADEPDHSCIYPAKLASTPFESTPVHPPNSTDIALPQIYVNNNPYDFEENATNTPFWRSTVDGTGVKVYLPYAPINPTKYIYTFSDGFSNPNTLRSCVSGQTIGPTLTGQLGGKSIGTVEVPDVVNGNIITTRQLTVQKFSLNTGSLENCVLFDGMTVSQDHRIYRIIVSSDPNLFFTNYEAVTSYVASSTPQNATSTITLGTYCNPLGTFDFATCINYLFVPDSEEIGQRMDELRDNVYTKAPFGYFYRMYTILQTTSTTTLPVLEVKLPFSATEYETLTFDFQDMFIGAGAELDSIRTPFSDKSIREVLEPFVKLLLAIAVMYTILTDIMNSHKERDYN